MLYHISDKALLSGNISLRVFLLYIPNSANHLRNSSVVKHIIYFICFLLYSPLFHHQLGPMKAAKHTGRVGAMLQYSIIGKPVGWKCKHTKEKPKGKNSEING